MKSCILKLNVKTYAKLRDIYVHIYGNFSHYMNSSNTCAKHEVIVPSENKCGNGHVVHPHTHTDAKFTKCVRQLVAMVELRLLRITPDSNLYLYIHCTFIKTLQIILFFQEDNIGNNLTHIVRKHLKFIKSQRGKLNNSIS